jgi:hypothetical protein
MRIVFEPLQDALDGANLLKPAVVRSLRNILYRFI